MENVECNHKDLTSDSSSLNSTYSDANLKNINRTNIQPSSMPPASNFNSDEDTSQNTLSGDIKKNFSSADITNTKLLNLQTDLFQNGSSSDNYMSFNYSSITSYSQCRTSRMVDKTRVFNPRMVGDILKRAADSSRANENDKLLDNHTTRKKMPQTHLIIREITPEDHESVCNLLYENFRSLTGQAMLYWIIQHAYDLCIIIAINFILMSPKKVGVFSFLLLLYLFCRARLEIENHIRYNCPDLKNIYNSYKLNDKCNFWITELPSEEETNKSENSSSISCSVSPSNVDSGDEFQVRNMVKNNINCDDSKTLGCVGIAPYRGSNEVAQMVRLVVKRGCRRMRVGSRLLMQVEMYAREVGYKEIRIYTNNLNTEYMQFVKQNGYELIQIVRRGLMRGDLLIWSKFIGSESENTFGSKPDFVSATFLAE